jgi:hypothetical protein
MLYDITILTTRPAQTSPALPKLGAWLESGASKGKLLGCWFTEIGQLNQILLVRGYEDAGLLASERDQMARSDNPFSISEHLTGYAADTYQAFPFVPAFAPGSQGPVYEVRTYLMKPEGIAPTIELWRQAVPARIAMSPVTAALYSVGGTMPRFLHVWPYKSLEERQRIRGEAVAKGIWPPKGGPGWLLTQQSDIYLPAPFSPLK